MLNRETWRTIWRALLVGLVVYWVTMFVSTHLPSEYVDIRNMNDKVLHTVAYALLAVLLTAVVVRRSVASWYVYLFVFLAVVGYGAFDELSQQLSRGRQADWVDWYCDIFGAATGVTFVALVQPFFRRRDKGEQVAVGR